MFAQFTDSWVEDKVLFAYLSGGSCQCCGFAANAPVNELMSACTDLDTDDKRHHTQDESSWPLNVREAVWSNRVEFRRALKRDSSRYAQFWAAHWPRFTSFYNNLSVAQKLKLFQLRETELHKRISGFGFSDAYHLLLLTLLEQIQHFDRTMYPVETDAATPAEKMCVESLRFTQNTFVLHKTYHTLDQPLPAPTSRTPDPTPNTSSPSPASSGSLSDLARDRDRSRSRSRSSSAPEESLSYHPAGFLGRFVELGSTSILPRLRKQGVGESSSHDKRGADSSDDETTATSTGTGSGTTTRTSTSPARATSPSSKTTQSFASDRRLLRILIFRAFADQVMKAYKRHMDQQPALAAAAASASASASASTLASTTASGSGSGSGSTTPTPTTPHTGSPSVAAAITAVSLQLPTLSIEVASPSTDRSSPKPPLSPSALDLASPTSQQVQLQTEPPPPASRSRPNSAGKRAQHIPLIL